MNIKCLSHALSNDLSCYNNEHNINIEKYKNNESMINMPLHSGTHIDFPLHAKLGGKSSSDYKLSDLIFYHSYIKEILTNDIYIKCTDLTDIPNNVDFLIFKVLNNPKRNSNDYAYKNKGICIDLVRQLRLGFKNLKAIGINSISINAYQNKEPGRHAHKELLGGRPEILIVEDMNLDAVRQGILKKVIVSPLLVEKVDGVPVTIFAEVE